MFQMALNMLHLLCINIWVNDMLDNFPLNENDQSGVFLCLEVSISFTALVGEATWCWKCFLIEVCQCFLSFFHLIVYFLAALSSLYSCSLSPGPRSVLYIVLMPLSCYPHLLLQSVSHLFTNIGSDHQIRCHFICSLCQNSAVLLF